MYAFTNCLHNKSRLKRNRSCEEEKLGMHNIKLSTREKERENKFIDKYNKGVLLLKFRCIKIMKMRIVVGAT